MRDLVMLLVIAAFFGLCLAYVWWCDRTIGPDPTDSGDRSESADAPEFVSQISPVAGAFGDTNGGEVRSA